MFALFIGAGVLGILVFLNAMGYVRIRNWIMVISFIVVVSFAIDMLVLNGVTVSGITENSTLGALMPSLVSNHSHSMLSKSVDANQDGIIDAVIVPTAAIETPTPATPITTKDVWDDRLTYYYNNSRPSEK